jgi:hypothetical protein
LVLLSYLLIWLSPWYAALASQSTDTE